MSESMFAPRRPPSRFVVIELMREHNYFALWMSSTLWQLARWMETLVLGWLMLELTNSPWHVALVGFYREGPRLLFSAFGGAIADRLNRRNVVVGAQVIDLVASFGLAFVILIGQLEYWHIVAVALAVGFSWAVDWPTRRSLMANLVEEKHLVNAMALERVSMYLPKLLGPLGAGAFLAFLGAGSAYLFLGFVYVASALFLVSIRYKQVINTRSSEPVWKGIGEGVHYAYREQAVFGVIAITAIMQLCVFPYTQFIPVFARDILVVGPLLMGLLGSADGIGATLGAVSISSLSSFKYMGLTFIIGSLIMAILLALFSISKWFAASFLLMMLVGLARSGYGTTQSTIVLLATSDGMRGRAMGILAMAIGVSPLGMLLVGAIGKQIGVGWALAGTSILGAILVGMVGLFIPKLRRC